MTPPPEADAGAREERWALAPLVDLHWRRWEREWLVFDSGSGQTHMLDTLDALVLLMLEPGAAAPATIAEAIAAELELDPAETGDVLERLPESLASLQRLGLTATIDG
ncbi:HPr-rel-A system PqqD family peptide chaperone [Pelomonas sp. KK5]|uniref:HPr-rel-A system PqqD family peptide chaperone n=1 Tax=Pelomonas sp. KK5 TaxID=1855730 RepID=UPI0009FB531E|nr:HPr-rel-A system PqqD family peptide chaperone [Pelomonas sp. KK5]